MNRLSLTLKNCFGIRSLEHEFCFNKANANVVYAPNGVMKTSLAKTLLKLSQGGAPEELLYGRQPEYSVQLDGEAIQAEEILVVQPFDPSYEAGNLSSLLVNSEQKARYDEAYKQILDARHGLVRKFNRLSKVPADKVESTLNKDLGCDNIFDALGALAQIDGDHAQLACVPYAKVFDSKVLKLLEDGDVSSNIIEYTQRYQDLIEQSALFQRGKFSPVNAGAVSKVLKKEKFFEAEHKLLMNGTGDTITEQAQLDALLEDETQAILGDGELKAIGQKIVAGVAPVKSFQELLEAVPDLAAELGDLNLLKKKLWASYYYCEKDEVDALIEAFNQKRDQLAQIEQQAQLENTLWHEAQEVFKQRFHVPFGLDIEDHTNVILGTKAPNMVFTFEDEEGQSIRFDRGQLDSMGCLSVGERRAMYLLYVIFEFKARLKSGQRTVIFIDDIADSFDYKNKYAIIEYLKELAEEDLFRLVVLTHNFDFYRTFQSRVLNNAKWDCSFVANKSANEIKLLKGGNKDVANPFDLWKRHFHSNAAMLIAMIPFVRNLIEYRDGMASPTYATLTSLLHIKDDTQTITSAKLEVAIAEMVPGKPLEGQFDPVMPVIDLIYNVAESLIEQEHGDTVSLENKIVLSIAIRLKAEEFMLQYLQNKGPLGNNQTGKLFDRLSREQAGNVAYYPIRKTLSQVSLMTPENIHLNSFMYEPLMDMSTHHLIDLFNEIDGLEWPEELIIQ